MSEFRSRVLIAFLIAGVVGFALVNMVVDHRALGSGGRDLPWWSAVVLDVAVPVQKMVAVFRNLPARAVDTPTSGSISRNSSTGKYLRLLNASDAKPVESEKKAS